MPIDEDTLCRVYGRHPARVMPFDELHAGLRREVAARNVLRVVQGGLELFVYSNACVFDRNWNLFSLISRGLVLDPAARCVVATPFPKFFNFMEFVTTLPDLPFDVTEKFDGSLGIVFHHDGRWRVATKGALASDQAIWATEHLNRKLSIAALEPGTTYLCEIVYRANRIVVPYDFEGLVLLGAYDGRGDELGRDRLAAVASAAGMRVAVSRSYDSLDQLVRATRALGREAEGFVVRFANGLRIKLKGEEYCRVHRLISRCTPLALWESMMAGDDLDAMRRDLPEEMWSDFDAIRSLLEARLEALVSEVLEAAERVKVLSNKELGLLLQHPSAGYSELARDFLFACRKGDFRSAAATPGRVRDGLFRRFRPDGDVLQGYAPSSTMDRFREEAT